MEILNEPQVLEAINTPKVVTSTTIPVGMQAWARRNNIDINSIIETGFRTLNNLRRESTRFNELEETVERLQKAVDTMQSRIIFMNKKFEELKSKYNIQEDL